MELNEVQLMAVNISTVLKTIINDRISSSKIYDLLDEILSFNIVFNTVLILTAINCTSFNSIPKISYL